MDYEAKKSLKESLKEVESMFGDPDEDKRLDDKDDKKFINLVDPARLDDKDDKFINMVDPACWDCEKPIRLKSDCFPKGSWGTFDQVLFRCTSCWTKYQAGFQAKIESENKERKKLKDAMAKKKLAKSATPKTTKKTATPKTTKKSKTTKKPATPKTTKKSKTTKITFAVGDNVVAKWTDGICYPAQIFGVDKGKYNVYFPQDGAVLQVARGSMSIPSKKSLWSKMKRSQFVNLDDFEHDTKRKGVPPPAKFGRYTPVGIGAGKDVNKYICRCQKHGTYMFDMGYVQQKLLLKCFPMNEKGEKLDSEKIYE